MPMGYNFSLMKIIANSVPLSNISTGIGRYIRNLYNAASEIETVHPFFFNGSGLLQSLSDSSHPETLINTLSVSYTHLTLPTIYSV